MSDDPLISIEENGDYWLSKSNAAYHIINHKVTSLVPIEENGYYSLFTGGSTYYVLDGNGNSTRLNDVDITNRLDPDNSFEWSLKQVEATGPGMLGGGAYALLWYTPSFWYQAAQGYSQNITDFSGHQINLYNASVADLESHFQADLDDNKSISIKLNQKYHSIDISGNQHHIDDGYGSVSIILKRDDVTIDPNSNPSWNVTQVEDSGTGYEVFWARSSGQFEVWKVGASGNYESTVTAHLWQHEKTFKVDLNGDGIDSGNNNIYGSIGNDTFDGGAGDDIINGREGHDTLIGGEGNDWISGDGGSGYAGNDILFGNAGNDDLRGRGGNDQIDGGTGSDTITTGPGSDRIILRIGDGGNTLSDADIITDFTDGSDKLRLDGGLLFSQLVIAQGSGAYASDTIISKGSEYLAILQGIDESLLSDVDFETVDIA